MESDNSLLIKRMNFRRLVIFALLLFLLWVQKGVAQTISGTVTDAQTTEALPFVNVYISNTTKGTQTDAKGVFTLKLQTSGYVKVVASMGGYKTFEQEFVLRPDEVRRLNIRLQTDTKFLNEVKIAGKRDKQWKRLYKDFEREFLGRTKNARNCKILNPFEIDVKKKKQILTASAIPPIEIENKALGYGLSYQLESFETTPTAYQFSGKTLFKLLNPTDEAETQTWETNRNQAYRGSLRHFLASVVNKRSHDEGFRVYLEADSTDKISRNRYFKNNALIEIRPDSLALYDAVLQRVSLPNRRYEIHYLNRRDPQNWYFDLDREVTWITIKGAFFSFSYNGILENSRQIETSGSMGKRRVADFLPDDYQPTDAPSATYFDNSGLIAGFQKQEKILLYIDKNGYAAGDTLHYQLRVIDATTHVPIQQTLLYLTVRSQNQWITQQKLWVEHGELKGKWLIPDSLTSETYQLIVHNQWSRNFDEKFWARKNFQVITKVPSKNLPIDSLQVRFFPESGHLIAGLSNRIGLASFTKSGVPIAMRGWVITQNGRDTLTTFQSEKEGYGSFYFTPSSTEKGLKVVLENGLVVQSFPQIIAKGYLLQIEALKDTTNITIKIINNLQPTEWKPMRLWIHLRGQILYEAIVTPKRNLTIARIPREDLEGTGVVQVLLLDALNHTIASNAFYQPPPTDDDENRPFDPDLFASELYGGIFPSAWLKEQKNLLKNANLMLLTHPIRPYSIEENTTFEYELGIKITGKVTQANHKPIPNTPIIGFVNTDSAQLHFDVMTDESGQFSSPPLQFYGKADGVIQLQSDKVKAAIIEVDTLPSFIPQWQCIPTIQLDKGQENDLLARLSQPKVAEVSTTTPLPRDFRRLSPITSTIDVEDAAMKLLPFVNILERSSQGITIKSNKAYFEGVELPLFVDGLPTTWESLRSLHGYEIEMIDIRKPTLGSPPGLINVVLNSRSNFLSDQNMKRFVVEGWLRP